MRKRTDSTLFLQILFGPRLCVTGPDPSYGSPSTRHILDNLRPQVVMKKLATPSLAESPLCLGRQLLPLGRPGLKWTDLAPLLFPTLDLLPKP